MKLARFLLVPFALLCVAFIRLAAKRGFVIRIGSIISERIGHLVGNTECYLCERDEGLHKGFDLFYHRAKPANGYIARMYERKIRVDKTGFLRVVDVVNRAFNGFERHTIQTRQVDRDILNLWEKHGPQLKLTAEEEARGAAQMREWGIPEGAKWVCLIARDAAYIPELSYHSYRDVDIKTYGPAALELAKRGYYVFRMGAKVEKPWAKFHHKIIDYATNGMRSEFMDVYLGAKCEFCISSGTGFDSIPAVFHRPIVFTNYVPVEYLNTYVNGLAIWKRHWKGRMKMTLKEILDSGAGHFMTAQEFEEAGIWLLDNSPEEIRDVVVQMADEIAVGMPYATGLKEQRSFWQKFPLSNSKFNDKPLHGKIKLRIGGRFLCDQSL